MRQIELLDDVVVSQEQREARDINVLVTPDNRDTGYRRSLNRWEKSISFGLLNSVGIFEALNWNVGIFGASVSDRLEYPENTTIWTVKLVSLLHSWTQKNNFLKQKCLAHWFFLMKNRDQTTNSISQLKVPFYQKVGWLVGWLVYICLLYTSPSPRD